MRAEKFGLIRHASPLPRARPADLIRQARPGPAATTIHNGCLHELRCGTVPVFAGTQIVTEPGRTLICIFLLAGRAPPSSS